MDGEDRRRPLWQWLAAPVGLLAAVALIAGVLHFGGALNPRRQGSPGAPTGQVALSAKLGFKCTLPVAGPNGYAFISFPDGAFTLDPSVKVGQGKPGVYSWDASVQSWVPVQAGWLSADGKSYAYMTNTSGVPGEPSTSALHLREIVGGKDRQLWSGEGGATLVGFAPGGIYFSRQPSGPFKAGPDLWVADASTGAVHRVGPNPAPDPAAGYFTGGPGLLGSGAAWGAIFSAPPQPAMGAPGKPSGPDVVQRMDLKDGTVSAWYRAPEGYSVAVIGFDGQGHPVLTLNQLPASYPQPAPGGTPPPPFWPDPPKVLLLTGPAQTAEIAPGTDTGFRPGSAVPDSHGTWFTVSGSIWLYDRSGLRKVAEIGPTLFPSPTPIPGMPAKQLPPGYTPPSPPPGWPSGPYVRIAGPCS